MEFLKAQPEKAGSKGSPLEAFCLVLLNANEFIYTN